MVVYYPSSSTLNKMGSNTFLALPYSMSLQVYHTNQCLRSYFSGILFWRPKKSELIHRFHRPQCASYGYRSCFPDERWRGGGVLGGGFKWYWKLHHFKMYFRFKHGDNPASHVLECGFKYLLKPEPAQMNQFD